MKRVFAAAITTGGLAVAALALAPAAQAAVTNPADNPHPITVKGDDGKTYVDGQDTLPGYDDEECTYIPGAFFDFDNDRVRYADGQSIPWTEWDRATGYEAWQAKQSAPKPGTPTTPTSSTPKPAASSAPKSGSSSTPKPAATTTKDTSYKSSTTEPSAAPTDAATAPAEKTPLTDGAPAAAVTAGATDAGTAPTEAAAGEAEQVALAAADPVSGQPTEADTNPSNDTGSAGLLILGGLAAVGLLTYAGYSVAGRRSRKATS